MRTDPSTVPAFPTRTVVHAWALPAAKASHPASSRIIASRLEIVIITTPFEGAQLWRRSPIVHAVGRLPQNRLRPAPRRQADRTKSCRRAGACQSPV